MLKTILLAAATLSSSTVLAAFGVTKSGNDFVVDVASPQSLVFTVNGKNCDITSIKYRGEELQSPDKGSQVEMGLGSANVKYEMVGCQFWKPACL